MTTRRRLRDPGLQPERTALSWQRTTFCVLILALAVSRGGFSRGDAVVAGLGSLASGLALALVVISYYRQKKTVRDEELTTRSSVQIKRLLSFILSLIALLLVFPIFLRLQ
jgi:O-antigen/teichoic acid export membrane protein